VVNELPGVLRDLTPWDDLIQLLRNQQLQDSLFLSRHELVWPQVRILLARGSSAYSVLQRGSPYPADLIQLWEDRESVILLPCLSGFYSTTAQEPTYQFDASYRDIFLTHPDLAFVLKLILWDRQHVMHARDYLDHILALLGLSYKVFRPLVEVLQSPASPLALKDWPSAFLADARRAGELYSTPQDITEDLVLLWIGRAKEVLSGSDFDLSPLVLLFSRDLI
jgi:hypothetical protein